MEAEARDILREALKRDDSLDEKLGTRVAARFRFIGQTGDGEIEALRGFTVFNPLEG